MMSPVCPGNGPAGQWDPDLGRGAASKWVWRGSWRPSGPGEEMWFPLRLQGAVEGQGLAKCLVCRNRLNPLNPPFMEVAFEV